MASLAPGGKGDALVWLVELDPFYRGRIEQAEATATVLVPLLAARTSTRTRTSVWELRL
jgi:hypothetical protein